MIEYLDCEGCGADISTEMSSCVNCNRDYKHSERTIELLYLRDQLEDMYSDYDHIDFMAFVEKSGYSDQPLVKYRIAKGTLFLLAQMPLFDPKCFCGGLEILSALSIGGEYYPKAFCTYFLGSFPYVFMGISVDDFLQVRSYLLKHGLDYDQKIESKLKQQMVATELGVDFIKEYCFFNDPHNTVNDIVFLHKREYLNTKFKKTLSNLLI